MRKPVYNMQSAKVQISLYVFAVIQTFAVFMWLQWTLGFPQIGGSQDNE